MRYRLNEPTELARATEYLSKLAGRGVTVDIKRVTYKRSLNQNSYYHLMLSYFGTQVGCSLEEAKQLIRQLQTELYQTRVKQVGDVSILASRSSADFNSAEMTKSIDDFRMWALETAGVDIPSPADINLLQYMQEIIEQNANYL